jgi:hypothetical protein
MYEVKDGSRTLKFSGQLLGESSSYRGDSYRWIEFKLYRTETGKYILSRIGVSRVFHSSTCLLVKKYGLSEVHPTELRDEAIPCNECNPSEDLPLLFPEKDRTWAQVSDHAGPVLDALYKQDHNGARYLTHVAQRLLEQASAEDANIDLVYRVEMIP